VCERMSNVRVQAILLLSLIDCIIVKKSMTGVCRILYEDTKDWF